MKNLLAKLLGMFKQADPQKPVEPWPFPAEKECCGGCNKPAKKTKSLPVKKQKAKNTEKKPATKKVKK